MRMRVFLIAGAALLPMLSGGCLAKAALDVASAPVKATGKVADWATTSQSESDRNYGRKMRRQEEREARARKRAYDACRRQQDDDCERYRAQR